MKLKTLFGALVSMGIMMAMAVCAQAATYSVDQVASKPGEEVTVNFKVAPDSNDNGSITLNGFAAEIGYDASSVVPKLAASKDATDADCYATAATATAEGILVADNLDSDSDGTTDKISIGWAAASPITITEETKLCSVTFTVQSAAKTTSLSVKLVQIATDGSTLEDVSSESSTVSVVNGEITITDDFLRGDANGDGVVDIKDATVVGQYTVGTTTILDENMLKADANADGVVDIKDATVIGQYTVGLTVIPE